jgi:hypothetical protein
MEGVMGFIRNDFGRVGVETRRESFVLHSSSEKAHPEFYYYDLPDIIAALTDAYEAERAVVNEQRADPPAAVVEDLDRRADEATMEQDPILTDTEATALMEASTREQVLSTSYGGRQVRLLPEESNRWAFRLLAKMREGKL